MIKKSRAFWSVSKLLPATDKHGAFLHILVQFELKKN